MILDIESEATIGTSVDEAAGCREGGQKSLKVPHSVVRPLVKAKAADALN